MFCAASDVKCRHTKLYCQWYRLRWSLSKLDYCNSVLAGLHWCVDCSQPHDCTVFSQETRACLANITGYVCHCESSFVCLSWSTTAYMAMHHLTLLRPCMWCRGMSLTAVRVNLDTTPSVFPSVLWYCWLCLLTCKTVVSQITYTVLAEIKPCSLTCHSFCWHDYLPWVIVAVSVAASRAWNSLLTSVSFACHQRIWPFSLSLQS